MRSMRRFHFEAFLPKVDGFLETVKGAWSAGLVIANPFKCLATKLAATAKALTRWNDRFIGSNKEQILIANELILRHSPSSDPLLSVSFYKRTSEQQAALGFLVDPPSSESGEPSQNVPTVEENTGQLQKVPHGSVGAVACRRGIAQGNSDEISAALFRYTTPEESDSAAVEVPELKLELLMGTLGGNVTTVEVEDYERSWKQNQELGLNDMDTSSADNAYNTTTRE
ncbi:hypothetical protein ACQ4PT_040473 [Festuca glaucescens]